MVFFVCLVFWGIFGFFFVLIPIHIYLSKNIVLLIYFFQRNTDIFRIPFSPQFSCTGKSPGKQEQWGYSYIIVHCMLIV